MDAKSQEKVLKAGFTIIRTDDQPAIRIKYKGKCLQNWLTLEKFQTKAARDRRFAEMLQDPKTIQD